VFISLAETHTVDRTFHQLEIAMESRIGTHHYEWIRYYNIWSMVERHC